jgi:hypothetical protein
MASLPLKVLAATALLAGIAACKSEAPQSAGSAAATDNTPATTDTGGDTGTTGGSGTTGGGGSGGGSSIPTLVSVNLQNVLNDLSVSLQVNRDSIPVTAQVPIDVAASVCGVSVDALAASLASGNGKCTATTTSAQLNQVVQQQISTGGNVTGGPQITNVPTNNVI